MGVSENEGTEFHDGDETRQQVDLRVGVTAVHDSRQGEQLCSLVDFGPESMFETLLGVF